MYPRYKPPDVELMENMDYFFGVFDVNATSIQEIVMRLLLGEVKPVSDPWLHIASNASRMSGPRSEASGAFESYLKYYGRILLRAAARRYVRHREWPLSGMSATFRAGMRWKNQRNNSRR